MKFHKRKQQLARLKKIQLKKDKFELKRNTSKPTRSDPKASIEIVNTKDLPTVKEQPQCVVGSENWLLSELEKRWRVKVTFLRSERYCRQDPKGVYVLKLANLTLKRQAYYTELSTAVYAKTSYDDFEEMQLNLFATAELDSVITLPLYRSTEYSPSTLVVIEQNSVLDFNPTLETLNMWLDAITKEGLVDFSGYQAWLKGHHVSTVEQFKLHLLLKKLMQLEAKLATSAAVLYTDGDRSGFFALDAALLTHKMIDREVLDTILLRHPVLSQTFLHLSSCYKRGRFALCFTES
jgi:hypothetical protein